MGHNDRGAAATIDIQNRRLLAVCLHASASSSRQWSNLVADFAGHMRIVTPGLVGYGDSETFQPGTNIRMNDEVANVLAQIAHQTGKTNGPPHLIGHSYGGAVVLQVALLHLDRVARLTVYEPAQFLLLFENGLNSPLAHEIASVHQSVQGRLKSPLQRWAAARRFVKYGSGRRCWKHIPCKRQRRFARLVPKIAAAFSAIFTTQLAAEDCAAHMATASNPRDLDPLIAQHVLASANTGLL